MSTAPVEVVLFDLGGVLTEFRGAAALAELTGEPEDAVWSRWLHSPWIRRFESGRCSEQEFAEGVIAEWGLPFTPAELLAAFGSWLLDPIDQAQALVREAARRSSVGCLSNTNTLHWERVIGRWPLLDAFEHRFLSFELGLVKPDAEIFAHVTASLPCLPGQIVFLDDNLANVEGAAAAGIVARHVRGPEQARAALDELGLL